MINILKYIYKITNKLNNKSYIGQTKDYIRRFQEHRKMSSLKNSNYICLLYRAFNKYGLDNFSFGILEITENYNEREIYYIKLFDSVKNGYNITKGGENPPLICGEDSNLSNHTQNEIEQIINDLKNTNKSYKDIALEYNYDNVGSISRINCGLTWHQGNETYPLRQICLEDEQVKEIINRLKNTNDSQKIIAKDFGIARSTVTMINIGKNHWLRDIEYPIRKKE